MTDCYEHDGQAQNKASSHERLEHSMTDGPHRVADLNGNFCSGMTPLQAQQAAAESSRHWF